MKIKKEIQNYFLVISIITAVFTILFLASPKMEDTFLKEGMFMELSSTFIYLQVFIIGLGYLSRTKSKTKRTIGYVISAFGILGFLEETSFGRDLFYHFDRPYLYSYPIDSLHDFAGIVKNILFLHKDRVATVFLIILFLAIAIPSLIYAKKHYKKIIAFLKTNTGIFFSITFITMVISGLIDLQHFTEDTSIEKLSIFFEELLELFASIALLFAALTIKRRSNRQNQEEKNTTSK